MLEMENIKKRRARKRLVMTVIYTFLKYLGITVSVAGGFAAMVAVCCIDSDGEAGNLMFLIFVLSCVACAFGYGIYIIGKMVWSVTD